MKGIGVMTDNKEFLEEENCMLITLTDDDGNDVDFELLDVIEYDHEEYIVLIENDENADEVVILKINSLDEETEEYVSIDDEELLLAVFEKFKSQYTGDITFA